MATTVARSRRRALLVGINQYDAPYQLGGCVNDAEAWAAYLRERGFQTTTLLDRAATGAEIRASLARLIREAVVGDVLLFVFSGHGTTIRDREGDEGDAWDEAIVPQDFDLIVDDQMRQILDQLPAGVGLTLAFDSCFSGTVTRFAGGNVRPDPSARAKFIPGGEIEKASTRKVPGLLDRALAAARAVLTRGGQRTTAPIPSDALRWVQLSACKAEEVAYERAGPDGKLGGDFTREAIAALRASGTTLTLGGLVTRTISRLGEDRAQTPTLDGPAGSAKRTLVTVPKVGA